MKIDMKTTLKTCNICLGIGVINSNNFDKKCSHCNGTGVVSATVPDKHIDQSLEENYYTFVPGKPIKDE